MESGFGAAIAAVGSGWGEVEIKRVASVRIELAGKIGDKKRRCPTMSPKANATVVCPMQRVLFFCAVQITLIAPIKSFQPVILNCKVALFLEALIAQRRLFPVVLVIGKAWPEKKRTAKMVSNKILGEPHSKCPACFSLPLCFA